MNNALSDERLAAIRAQHVPGITNREYCAASHQERRFCDGCVLLDTYDALLREKQAVEVQLKNQGGGMAEWCTEEREQGNSGCGACSICVKEFQAQLAAAKARVKELERSRQVDAPLHGW